MTRDFAGSTDAIPRGNKRARLRLMICTDLGGGGNLVPFVVRGRAIFRGTFFKSLRNYGYHFHNFFTFNGIMGVLFRGFFIISGIMAQIFIRFVELWP